MPTCHDTSCDFHGWCHCGCQQKAKIHRCPTERRRGYIKGEPYEHLAGHQPNFLAARIPGCEGKPGFVLIASVRDALEIVRAAYGLTGSARRIGCSRSEVSKYRGNRATWMRRDRARRIQHLADDITYGPDNVYVQYVLPFGPLDELMRQRNADRSLMDHASERQFYRSRKTGTIPLEYADRIACEVLGVNPASIWGAQWFDPPIKEVAA